VRVQITICCCAVRTQCERRANAMQICASFNNNARNGQGRQDVRERLNFLFLNIGHFLDHLFMLVFATVAALTLTREWQMSYAELIPYATPGFVAFGAFALPAGWLADRWSRQGMMVVFFVGIGLASTACAFAQTPLQLAIGLFAIGVFAAIYHPVGIGLVLDRKDKSGMRVAINGVWGNMGVAVAALLTALMIDHTGWRSAFVWPGVFSIALGIVYAWLIFAPSRQQAEAQTATAKKSAGAAVLGLDGATFARVFAIILLTTALGGLVFQSTTFALPKILDERAASAAETASMVGWMAFFAFSIGSIGQLLVGFLLDRKSPRSVFIGVAIAQVVLFAAMLTVSGYAALIVAAAFMFATFGQIPINDVLVGRIARAEWRSRMLAIRYTTTISVMAITVPLVGWIYANWGFDRLFVVLSVAAALITAAVLLLPKNLNQPQPAAA